MSSPDVVTPKAPAEAADNSVSDAVRSSIRIRFPEADQHVIESAVRDAVAGFGNARITTFVGILVEREAARLMTNRSHVGAPGSPR